MDRGGWLIFCLIWMVLNALAQTSWATFSDYLVSLAIFVSAANFRERINLRRKKTVWEAEGAMQAGSKCKPQGDFIWLAFCQHRGWS